MSHTHIYHITVDMVLTLPDHAGWYDRLLQFQCVCGQHTVVHHGKEETPPCPQVKPSMPRS